MKALIRLNSALIVGCLRVFFWLHWAMIPKGIIKPYEGTILTTGKVCCVQYLLVFRLVSGYRGERLISGLRRKDWILRALLLAVTSLWPQKVSSIGEFFSARWKLLLISDQAKNLVKNWFEGRGSMSRFQPHPDFIRRHRLLLLVKVNVANSVKKETNDW